MRIAQVVTYISDDGAFGGPVSVALEQSRALAARGHHVTVYAASDASTSQTTDRDGYRLRTFPARRITQALGFAGMYAPGLSAALRNAAADFDVAHVHLARDLVTLPAALMLRRSGVVFVAQPHGMIDRSRNPLSIPVDAVGTKRVLQTAGRVLVLTDRERDDIQRIAPASLIESIANGVRVSALPSYAGRAEEVLFLARLHPRKRPMVFVEMAEIVADVHPTATFTICGPDEGEGAALRDAIASSRHRDRIRMVGAVRPADASATMARASAFVLPSIGEVFPMSILEAFQAGTPVITTDSLGIASDCTRYGAAEVTNGSARALADAVVKVLMDRKAAETLREGAQEYLSAELDIAAVARQLETTYREVRSAAT